MPVLILNRLLSEYDPHTINGCSIRVLNYSLLFIMAGKECRENISVSPSKFALHLPNGASG